MDKIHGETNGVADLENEPAAVGPEQEISEEELDRRFMERIIGDPEGPDAERRQRATKMLILYQVFDMRLADIWLEFNPGTLATRESCRQSAYREIRWLRDTYSLDIGLLLEMHGMGDSALLEELKRYLKATTRIKSGVVRKIDRDTGRVVSEEFTFIEVRDNRAWGDAIQKWMTIMGYRTRRKPPTDPKEMPVTQQHVKPEDLNPDATTGAATTIHMPEKVSQEENQRRLREYLARKSRQRAQQSDEDLVR